MKKTTLRASSLCAFLLMVCVAVSAVPAGAADVLRYSSSPQVLEAFGHDRVQAFTQKTGIKVDLGAYTSAIAIDRVINGFADIASTAQRLTPAQLASGYVETSFCRDPLAIIVNAECPVTDITNQQIQAVFSGKITNWKDLGGPDKAILVIVPSDQTAAYANFHRDVMAGGPIKADIVTSSSTLVIETTRRMPWSISFTAQGAARLITHGLKKLKINAVAPDQAGYPYFQEYSFVTRGTPTGLAKRFIEFCLSPEGKDIIRKKGMIPIE
jgi:phosphate transport system substrate-binding protein